MRLKKGNLKRVLCAALACALVVMPVTSVSAATARATTMKLEKTEGTVTLKTQNGSARKISNGMRLYNGNTLATGNYSYAYVSLDSTKAVKVDQSSSATLRQSGKELELLVKSGKLFFNVSQPLTEKENMNVRTSTMVTGIRGTCGVVEYVDINKSRLYLIEGQVTLGSGENATTVYGGQTATVVLQPKKETDDSEKPGDTDKPGDMNNPEKEKEQKVLVEKLTEEKIPSVALQEIVNDPVLQEKIEKTTELKIEKIEEVFEQFQKEEAERIEAEKENDKDKESQTTPSTSGSGGSGSSSSSDSGATTVKETTLDGTVTPEMITKAFQDYQRVHIGANAKMQFAADDTLTIPGGKMLHIWGNQSIPTTTTITVGGGTTQGLLCVVSSAAFTAGTINVTANSRLEDHGTLSCASLTGGANAILINNKELTVSGNMKLSNGSTYENHGVLTGSNLTSDGGATIKNTDLIKLSGAYTSAGTDTYSDGTNGLLISGGTSANTLPSKFLLRSTIVSAATSGSTTELYASHFNQRVADYLYESSQTGIVSANFEKAAIVSTNVSLQASPSPEKGYNIQLILGSHTLQVDSGTLTLDSGIQVTGSSTEATIKLSGGNLVLTGTGSSSITNASEGMGVLLSDASKITWSNPDFAISAYNGPDRAISGVGLNDDGTVTLPDGVTIKAGAGYAPVCNDGWFMLQFVPSEYTNGTVTAVELNQSLSVYQAVTVGEAATASLDSNDIVTIPEGKTLTIKSKETGSEVSGYSAFNLASGAQIILEDGATLNVSGTISGAGTIRNTNTVSSSKLKVEAGGTVRANTLQLMGCDIENAGIIDAGTISTVASGTIQNLNLIKTQSYTASDATYSYSGTSDSVLICNTNITQLDGASLLVTATASGSAVSKQYFYAEELNELMKDRINNIKMTAGGNFKGNGASLWTFAKEAEINSAITIDFDGSDVNMGSNQMTIAAKGVELDNIGNMTGNGTEDKKAVIYLTGAGSLTLGGTEKGTISNTNSSKPYYAIAASDDILKSQEAHLFWKNAYLKICASKGQSVDPRNQYIVQGGCIPEDDENGQYVLPKWVDIDGYSVEATQGSGIASLVR